MKVFFPAAGLSAACLLSACGFAPPKPPMPADSPRVPINRADPRLYDGAPLVAQSPQSAPPVAVSDKATPPASKTPTPTPTPVAPAAASASPSNMAQPEVQAPKSTASLAIPVPVAPAKAEPVPPAKKPDLPHTPGSPKTPSPHETAPPPPVAGKAASAAEPATATPVEKPANAAAKADTGQRTTAPASPVAAAPIQTVDTTSADALKTPPTPIVVKRIWHLGPQDKTVRQALARWAKDANWTFGPDQWEVSFDLPIEASADFPAASFEEATQALTNSIALTDSPVRPCFYANKVLRIIPFNQSCDRSGSPTARP
ncbi:hypothetical protein CAL26_01510 [Bordetella genomosp. 9]|uniref:Toxin co-regulated pilus biosynthesis protein Q C-terminal domain-containing protein n=1 Tax=Bordetella genomosp. 9 TaxID=1416803 RepID=A0A261RLW9_9BORD|nr:toxin co-regulated pilus biosynthesis Q family protein [Bordetella genomosp. 9]OZI26058.1 hypothetical protein CAL26_01510 [Bordetella genomosp. 9]